MTDPKTIMSKGSYLDVTYDVERAPYGPYPAQLAKYIANTYFRVRGRLVDVGCGRCEFLSAFANLGFDVAGIDISPKAPELSKGHNVIIADLERDPFPFSADSFDFAFSKSVIEHLRAPVTYLDKIFHGLKPGGIAVVMTPSWIHNAWGPFYIDHTHVTPFTGPSLTDAMSLAGFSSVSTIHFYQLPFLWQRQWLLPFVRAFSQLPLHYRPMDPQAPRWPAEFNKLIRFSKEVMLLSVGKKL